MPEVTRERQAVLVRAAFTALLEAPDGLAARQVVEAVANSVPLTAHELGFYEAVAPLTDEGRAVYTSIIDPGDFMPGSRTSVPGVEERTAG
jgi:hypothetical protein